MYISVIFGFLPTTDKHVVVTQCIVSVAINTKYVIYIVTMCIQVHVWVYGIGYLLVYGTILAKMWRVYHIFHNPNPSKTVKSSILAW